MTDKCPKCGGYIHYKPFYQINRSVGILSVWVCPKCGYKIERWDKR